MADTQSGKEDGLRRLGLIYWYPVYVWWRRAGLPAKKAMFAMEGCFERWLGVEPPLVQDPGAARLRDWVIARMESLASRGVKLLGAPPFVVDEVRTDERFAQEPEGTPYAAFHRRWALTVLETAMDMLRAENADPKSAELFSLLLPMLLESDDEGGAWDQALAGFRKRFRKLLRKVIGDTVMNAADVNAEMSALMAAVSFGNGLAEVGGLSPEALFACGMRKEVNARVTLEWTPPSLAEAYRLFPKYEILELIACGGMGAVFRARQATLDRTVAIKLMPLEVSANQEFSERFCLEAKTMARLSHPHIVAVYEFGKTEQGHLFFVMEYVGGENLHQLLQGDGLSVERALAIFDHVLDAMDYAHSKGVIHRDIKPANVIVGTAGAVKVVDFGLARLNQPGAPTGSAIVTGVIMGTPDYMAPERLNKTQVDHRADIYSLGVMLYEMLVRDVPGGVFDPPSKRVGTDARLDAVVIRAMQQARERRYQTCEEMRTAIAAILATRAKPVPVKAGAGVPMAKLPVAVGKSLARRNLTVAVGTGIAALLTVVLWPKSEKPGLSEAEKMMAARALNPKAAQPVSTSTPTPIPVSKPALVQGPEEVATMGVTRFQLVNGALPWLDAKSAAEALGGKLATINSKEKDDFLRKAFSPALSQSGSFAMLGGYRLKTNGGWQWTSDDAWAYEGWTQGEPSHNAAKPGELPVFLVLSRFTPAKGGILGWNDKTQSEVAHTDFATKCRGFILESPRDAISAREAAEKGRWKDLFEGATLPDGWALAAGVLKHPVGAISTWQPDARMRDGALRIAFEWTIATAVQIGMRNDGNSMLRVTFSGANNTGAIGMRVERYSLNDRSSVVLLPDLKLAPQPSAKGVVRIEIRAIGELVFITANERTCVVRDTEPKEGYPYLWIRKDGLQTVSKLELLKLDAVQPLVAENTKPPAAPVSAPLVGQPPVSAPPIAPLPVPVPPVESETAKWLAATDAQWQGSFQRDVTAPFDKAVAELRQQYVLTLDKNIAAASQAAKLNDALVWRNERVRIGGQAPHDAPNDPSVPPALIQLRDNWRKEFSKFDQARLIRAKALHARYDALLDQNQKTLTQRQRLDEAQLLKIRRDEIARDWLKPALDLSPAAAPATLSTGKLKGREALDFLLASRWHVVVDVQGKRTPVLGPESIPHGTFEISELITPEKVAKDPKTVTDEDLAQLAPMRGLRKLELRGAPISGVGLGFLAGADELTDFVVESGNITDAVYSAIMGQHKIQRLVIHGGKDFMLTRLADLPCVTSLQSIDVRGGGSFLPPASLARARQMKHIAIERGTVSAEQLGAMALLQDLVKLSFNNCQSLPAGGWKALEHSKIEHISFQNSPLIGIDLSFLAGMRKLETLEIDGADAHQLAKAAGATAMRTLVFSPSRPGTDTAITTIVTAFPRIESVTLGRASQSFTAAGIRAMAKLSKLKSVTFSSPLISDEQLAAIAELPFIETLRLSGSGITNVQIPILAKSANLALLFLAGTKLTADVVEQLKNFRLLRELDIRDTDIPPGAVAELRKALPKCKIER